MGDRVGRSPPQRGQQAHIAQDGLRLDSEYLRWGHACSGWRTDVEAFNLMLERAVEDMHALSFRCDGYRVPAAGIPWYSTVFGRDSIITALQTLPLNPAIATETLRFLAARQGEKHDEFTEEAAGKDHARAAPGRDGAERGNPPHPVLRDGRCDSPVARAAARDLAMDRRLRAGARAAAGRGAGPRLDRPLRGCRRRRSRGVRPTLAGGLANQGWKDSGDGVPYPDGSLPCPPIALVEVQGYVYDAKLRLGALYEALGRADDAARLTREAERLRETIDDRFWMEEMGTYALALDGAKQRIPTVTTNAGHLLWSRVPSNGRAERMATRLFQPDMYSGWGLRTLSASHPAFNPMSYHNGSVWPHDNALIALGLGFYGRHSEASWILGALYDACSEMGSSRLPELYCGLQRGNGMRPVRYPVSCSPQAWASGAFFMVLQGTLGLFPAASEGVLHVRTPALPDFLRELTITRLRIGGSSISLQFRRHRDRTLVNLLEAEGDPLRVQINL